jgi:hypothetical protein
LFHGVACGSILENKTETLMRIVIPPGTPDPSDIATARVRACLSTREAASLIQISEHEWEMFECGRRLMPWAFLYAFNQLAKAKAA